MPRKAKAPSSDAGSRPEAQAPGSRPDFDTWAVVEVMGHNTYAGRVTEQAIGGASFIRVDVPEIPAAVLGPMGLMVLGMLKRRFRK